VAVAQQRPEQTQAGPGGDQHEQKNRKYAGEILQFENSDCQDDVQSPEEQKNNSRGGAERGKQRGHGAVFMRGRRRPRGPHEEKYEAEGRESESRENHERAEDCDTEWTPHRSSLPPGGLGIRLCAARLKTEKHTGWRFDPLTTRAHAMLPLP
jgi:hypothetical protein